MMTWAAPLTLSLTFLLIQASSGREPNTVSELDTNRLDAEGEPLPKGPKLLVIMLDGFRWDYYKEHKSDLSAFDELISEGVMAEWLEPVFPSLSYPNWHTISTGLYPEVHGIIGNYMYDQRKELMFDLNNVLSTREPSWWQSAEPIWTTATREKKKVYLRQWSRCDVPFDDTLPNGEFSGYYPESGIGAFQKTLNATLHKLRENDLLMVYGAHIDNIGHQYGPESLDMTIALKELNKVFKWFLDELYDNYQDIEKDLNIVILSDHGMVESGSQSSMKHVQLKRYLNQTHVMRVIGDGGFSAIAPLPRYARQVYDGLKQMEGVDVYRREEIPDEFRYKNSPLAENILVVAKPGYNILGLPQEWSRSRTMESKQIPTSATEPARRSGSHGYFNITEMRGIFLARGPEFHEGLEHPPIRMEDVYQMLARVLKIPAQPHNGTWSRVSGMFKNGAKTNMPFSFIFPLLILLCVLNKWNPFLLLSN